MYALSIYFNAIILSPDAHFILREVVHHEILFQRPQVIGEIVLMISRASSSLLFPYFREDDMSSLCLLGRSLILIFNRADLYLLHSMRWRVSFYAQQDISLICSTRWIHARALSSTDILLSSRCCPLKLFVWFSSLSWLNLMSHLTVWGSHSRCLPKVSLSS